MKSKETIRLKGDYWELEQIGVRNGRYCADFGKLVPTDSDNEDLIVMRCILDRKQWKRLVAFRYDIESNVLVKAYVELEYGGFVEQYRGASPDCPNNIVIFRAAIRRLGKVDSEADYQPFRTPEQPIVSL